jgi:hypothetical protein
MDGRQSHSSNRHLAACAALALFATIVLVVAGCSNAPVADFLDFVSPGKFPANAKDASGGVCIQQGGPAGGVIIAPPVAPPVAPPIAPPVAPPPPMFKGAPMSNSNDPPPPAGLDKVPLRN